MQLHRASRRETHSTYTLWYYPMMRCKVTFNASISSIFFINHIRFWPWSPRTLSRWHDGQRLTQVYCNPWTMWWASLGPGSSQTEHGNSLTFAKCLRSLWFNLLFTFFPYILFFTDILVHLINTWLELLDIGLVLFQPLCCVEYHHSGIVFIAHC